MPSCIIYIYIYIYNPSYNYIPLLSGREKHIGTVFASAARIRSISEIS